MYFFKPITSFNNLGDFDLGDFDLRDFDLTPHFRSKIGSIAAYVLGLIAVLVAQFYVHAQLARPLGWAIFTFMYNVLCFIVIGALVMIDGADPKSESQASIYFSIGRPRYFPSSKFSATSKWKVVPT